MLVWGRPALPAFMAAMLAATAGAQQKACDIDEGTPNQVARAMLDLQIAQSSGKPEDAAAKLKDAIKLLSEGDKTKNPVGRAMVTGRTLVLWMAQPSMSSGITTRGALGFVTDPAASYDIIAGIDSAFTVVEGSNPECAAQTSPWRQQKAWVDLVNHAVELGNASGKSDSAVIAANRSLMLYHDSPYAYMVLAKVAAEKNQPKDAINYYKQAIAVATDTVLADTRRGLLQQVGGYAADLSEAATGADKAAYIAEAKAAYEALAKDPGTKFADAARAGRARLAALSGDTTAIKATYADQLANPGAFSYNSIMNAAVTAARASQTKDAIKLFDAARSMNPYHRDVLYNLARLYLLDSSYAKGLEVARSLIKVDPSNPDNYQLMVLGYSGIKKDYDVKYKKADSVQKGYGQKANTVKNAKVVSAYVDSAARNNKVVLAYQDSARATVDSALKYNDVMQKLPARIAFSEFTPSDAKATLGGTIANMTDAARSFAVKIEFLDKAGTVVSTEDVNVGPVQPKSNAPFTATGTGAGIVAFRYAPIT
ncbi:MAG: tetratricopeptide repeat protein [Gemmatimonadaceae bacterium]